jgi:hypothetical protein
MKLKNKTICFTGKLAELTREEAEKESRARSGLTQKSINKKLDYLVIGSIPSNGWKFGDYGNKIVKARQIIEDGAKLKMISEDEFMESLENHPVTNSGDIDEKLLICRYKALVLNGDFDIDGLENYMIELKSIDNSHISAKLEDPLIYQELYGKYEDIDLTDMILFQCRIIIHLSLDSDSSIIMNNIKSGFNKLDGVDGEFSWSEKTEGSSSFATMIKTIPQKYRLKNKE